MEASSFEKNHPDDNVGSDSTLGGCSPLSQCGIVSLTGVITVCIGGVATHPLQVPVWVPLCMVDGLFFNILVGTLSVMIGRYF